MNRRALMLGVGLAAAGAGLLVATRARAAIVTSPGEAAASASLNWLNATLAAAGFDPMDNVAAFLAMIREAEHRGLVNDDFERYRTIIGGARFESFADHPRVRRPFTQTDGQVNYSSAAGAYQFLEKTWDRLAGKLELGDFSPEAQDRAAVELIREAGALGDVRAGRFDLAVAKVNRIWASLPGAPYPQRHRSSEFVRAAYESAGGSYA